MYSLLCTSVNSFIFLFVYSLLLNGIVAMGDKFRSLALKGIKGLVCSSGVFIRRRASGTSAWSVGLRSKDAQYMATHSNVVAAQNFDYFLVLDFEATCDNQRQLIPQVNAKLFASHLPD